MQGTIHKKPESKKVTYLTAVPAYGQDYKNAAMVKAAFKEGKDFRDPASGSYLNVHDLKGKNVVLNIRYKGLREICQVKVK